MNTSQDVWKDKHANYSKQDWVDLPTLFAESVVKYLPESGEILELGTGQGQDGRFFASKGYRVTSTDLESSALEIAREKSKGLSNLEFKKVDISKSLPFQDDSFEAVYAHLSLHYFNDETTRMLFKEIYRILKPSGVIAFIVNSTDDPEFNTGEKLEDNLFKIEGNVKRYFTVQMAKSYAEEFEVLVANNEGETYKDRAKGVKNLIQFIGQKAQKVK